MTRKHLRLLAALLCVTMALSGLCLTALATDETLDITYVEITGENFAADRFMGVDALYNLTGRTLFCSELIERFYQSVYGLTVTTPPGTPLVSEEGFWFETTQTPQPGDIAYATAASRGSAHYAIVREADPEQNAVTLFEQNWRWGDKAGVSRKIAYAGSPYTFYTLKSESGELPGVNIGIDPPDAAQEPALPVWSDSDAPSLWAQESVIRAVRYGISDSGAGGYQSAIRRGDFAKLAVNAARAMGTIPQANDPYEAVRELGLMGGDDSGDLMVDAPITREAAATVLARLWRLFGQTAQADRTALDGYADKGQISEWATDAAALLTQQGVMGGTGTGFAPREDLSTEQALALFVRIYEKIVQ